MGRLWPGICGGTRVTGPMPIHPRPNTNLPKRGTARAPVIRFGTTANASRHSNPAKKQNPPMLSTGLSKV